ncbi:hypothetical protein V2J09_018527 [Rumex salicifolius]
MEEIESGEAHSEEKALPETNKKRRFKTPSQVQALEEFYNEHKYPTDSMKAELAENLNLTERQISGWFCHRRLKDRRLLTEEAQATGRQENLSNGALQDQGSGLRQDSCGSTKRGDNNKLADLREVESRRFCDEDLPPADVHYGPTRHYGTSEPDETSSESDSDLQGGFYRRGRNVMDMETSRYGMPNASIPPSRGRAGPSGYLKIKGQVENVAITAVKRQLGRLYREDGPPLGVDFDTLPPDAFESPSRNPMHDRSTPIPLDVRGARFPPTLKNDLYVDPSKSKLSHASNLNTLPYHHQPLKKKSMNGDAALSQKAPSYSSDEYSAGETSVYDGNAQTGARPKHAVHGMKPCQFSSSRPCPSGGKLTDEWSEPWSHDYNDVNLKGSHKRASLESMHSNLKSKYKDSLDTEELVLSSRHIEPEELSGERRLKKEHQDPIRPKRLMNDMKASKRGRSVAEQDLLARPTFPELPPLTKQIRGSAMELPSSFSEDETALTSSSID